MNKTALKIFTYFILTSVIISTIMLCIYFAGFAFIANDTFSNSNDSSPRRILNSISENISTANGEILLQNNINIPDNTWCILLNEEGNIIWSINKPDDIPDHYTINDIANMTKWFLNDYPVYEKATDHGLLVLGTPKNSVGKYDIEYSMDWFNTLPQRILFIFLINMGLAALVACLVGINLYLKINTLTKGIRNMSSEKPVKLKEKGIFKEMAKNINETSRALDSKNEILAKRDEARSNWISGISHDIRTPLSMIMGYSESLEISAEIKECDRKKAEIIKSQSLKIKKLLEDLNLISSLEYDMQPSRKKPVKICPLIRNVVSEIINNGLSDKYSISLDLRYEPALISGDEFLLERAVFNIINNSITHNPKGCEINISEYREKDNVYLKISDNGIGVPDNVLKNINIMPKTAHGIGLPLSCRIFTVHGCKFTALNKDGFSVLIEFSLK